MLFFGFDMITKSLNINAFLYYLNCELIVMRSKLNIIIPFCANNVVLTK